MRYYSAAERQRDAAERQREGNKVKLISVSGVYVPCPLLSVNGGKALQVHDPVRTAVLNLASKTM